MKLSRIFYRRNLLLMYLVASILFSMAMVSVPVQASPAVRFYVDPEVTDGVDVDTIVKVDVMIESPPGWENTSVGIVGWRLYVKVDPAVLEPVKIVSGTTGYFLYDFCQTYEYYANEPSLLYTVNKTEGLFWDVAEFLMSFEDLGVGAGGSGKLATLWFKSKSSTDYSPIDLYESYYDNITAKIPVDIVEDGYYNMRIEHPVDWNDDSVTDFYVVTESNSTISNFAFNLSAMEIGFNVTGPDLTTGFCNVTIPKQLLDAAPEEWIVKVDDTAVVPTITLNATHTFIYFTYTHSTHMIQIVGTLVIPEFSAPTLLMTLLIVALAIAILAKKAPLNKRRRL